MFTGIVQEIGKVIAITTRSGGKRVKVKCQNVLRHLNEGASIAVDGACLTVESVRANSFEAFVSGNTLEKTTLGKMKTGTAVNLERPLMMGDELGGHMVLGHVDGIGKVRAKRNVSGNYELEVTIPADLTYGIVPEGSLTVNGVSLTIVDSHASRVKLIMIPLTRRQTNLGTLRAGDSVNIEIDILGKYMYNFYKENMRREP